MELNKDTLQNLRQAQHAASQLFEQIDQTEREQKWLALLRKRLKKGLYLLLFFLLLWVLYHSFYHSW
jgi:hypothetical protein